MDGTFIPLDGNEQNRRDLREIQSELEQNKIDLMYVTGRHLDLVIAAVQSYGLPSPPWMICDVGASIYQANSRGNYQPVAAYVGHLSDLVGDYDRAALVDLLADLRELRLQEDEKQTRFKLSYYCDAGVVDAISTLIEHMLVESNAPYRIIASIDPFTGDGLIDLLPRGVSKAYALKWWASYTQCDHESIIFAGDSGNDLAALTAGYRSIVVGNANKSVATEVSSAHGAANWNNRLLIANSPATSGVLEGLRHFLHLSRDTNGRDFDDRQITGYQSVSLGPVPSTRL